jgi:hypothetical protein
LATTSVLNGVGPGAGLILVVFLSALLSNYPRELCLTDIGTEGIQLKD